MIIHRKAKSVSSRSTHSNGFLDDGDILDLVINWTSSLMSVATSWAMCLGKLDSIS
jgi:hypothetical protein